jgi:hypothetical protein
LERQQSLLQNESKGFFERIEKQDLETDIKNEDFIKECVQVHNKLRSEVNPAARNMLHMTWDPVLAQIAKVFSHLILVQ